MPKDQSAYFRRRNEEFQTKVGVQITAVEAAIQTVRLKQSKLLKTKEKIYKHARVKKMFHNLTRPAGIEKVVESINIGTIGQEKNSLESPGEKWNREYEGNLTEMCGLVDDALRIMQKTLDKKGEEEKKYKDLAKKAEDFQNSCLSKLQDLKSEGRKPFQITGNESIGADYQYAKTPFQCYTTQ